MAGPVTLPLVHSSIWLNYSSYLDNFILAVISFLLSFCLLFLLKFCVSLNSLPFAELLPKLELQPYRLFCGLDLKPAVVDIVGK